MNFQAALADAGASEKVPPTTSSVDAIAKPRISGRKEAAHNKVTPGFASTSNGVDNSMAALEGRWDRADHTSSPYCFC